MENAVIELGAHSYIVEPYHINGDMAQIIVGKWCSLAGNMIFDLGFQHNYKNITTFPMHKFEPSVTANLWCRGNITIGNDVWIGNAVTIMSGVSIGDGAVIGANTTVRRDIEPYEIYNGTDRNKFRFTEAKRVALQQIAWWDWDDDKVRRNAHLLASENIDRFIHEHYTA